MLSENILSSNHAHGVCFRSENVSRRMYRDYNRDYFQFNAILIIRNRNRAGGIAHLCCNRPMSGNWSLKMTLIRWQFG